MDKDKRESISSLFEVVASLERKWANEWNLNNSLGFSKTHILLLDLLSNEGAKRPSAIAERLQITTGGVTVLTTKLMNSGLLKKTQHPSDRRVYQIEITEQGDEVLTSARNHVDTLIEKMFGMLSEDEIQTLRNIFAKLLKGK